MSRIRFGVELPQHLGFPYLKEMAQAIEDLGYDSVWIRDHLIVSEFEMTRFQQGFIENDVRVVRGDYLGCIPTMSAVAAVTKRVTIGTDILNIPRRNPVDIANEIGTIDQISNGRVILQGAVGHLTRDWLSSGIPTPLAERGKMLEEALTIIKALWTQDEPYTFKGRYYDIEEARIGCRPVQKPHPPIWLGVTKTLKRVARLADGFTLSHSMFGGTNGAFRASLETIHREARAFGRNPDSIEAAARFGLVMADDVNAAKDRADDHWGKLFMEPASWYREWAGDADSICQVIQPWIDAGARHIMLWPIPYSSQEERLQDIEYFAKKVIPRYR